jgi:parallel beta-helix repeat protein
MLNNARVIRKMRNNMKSRQYGSLFEIAILLAVLALQFGIRSALASETIYIRSDGSISPSSAPISTADKITYRLTGPLYNEIVIQKSGLIVEGNSQTIQGTGGGYGLTLNSVNGVTIRNVTVKNFISGVWLSNSMNINIANSTLTQNFNAIDLYSSTNNHIQGNSITDSTYGVYLVSSQGNFVEENNISRTEVSGVLLDAYSNQNTVSRNVFVDSGLLVQSSYQNSAEGNTVNGKPLVFLEDTSDFNVTSAGQVVLINCHQIQIENLDLTHTSAGVELWGTTHSRILTNNVTDSYYGIWLCDSSNNTITGNKIAASSRGIELWRSSNNRLFHNKVTNNTLQVHDLAWEDPEIAPSINVWDNGYPSGGNYWSDYPGQDSNGDGMGDTPYTIDANNIDMYPLMGTYSNSCDINHDLKVDMKDIGKAARAFNTRPGDALWNPQIDITGPEPLVPDGKVDMSDINLIARHFGEHY